MLSVFANHRSDLTPCRPGTVAPDRLAKGKKQAKRGSMGFLSGETKSQKEINPGYPSPRR